MAQGAGISAEGKDASAVFRGVTHLALDAKGRLAIPARHREALLHRAADAQSPTPGALVLTADPARCLLLYPRAVWEPIQARLMALSSFSVEIRGLQRLLVGHADDVDLDGSGRILIPPALRQYAALDHHVVLVGQGNKFELWDEAQVAGANRPHDHLSRRRPSARARRVFALMPNGGHVPVLLEEAVAALAIKPEGTYVDATFGRGGHARRILAALAASGRVVALDRDPAAETSAQAIDDARFTFRRAWFSELPPVLAGLGVGAVDGVLLDLGISSPQIDDPERGFSLRADGPLDMRMDPARGESAAAFLARADGARTHGGDTRLW